MRRLHAPGYHMPPQRLLSQTPAQRTMSHAARRRDADQLSNAADEYPAPSEAMRSARQRLCARLVRAYLAIE
ncbi:hypothetical protein GCM10011504_57660 [Siccirubricoccus deserti]|nr:hypothetical protein GCM10011504_57660 [Siccirubricoccus deserti]